MVTIKDVAKEAGVSIGSVSNVINNAPNITQETREKVLAAMEKLGYKPKTTIKPVKRQSMHCIGLIVPGINNPYYSELARGAEDVALKNQYGILQGNSDRFKEKEAQYIDLLLQKKVDGIIMAEPQMSPTDIVRLSTRCPLVLLDVSMNLIGDFDIINIDDASGTRSGMELLYAYGHRRIAFISGILASEASRVRMETYTDFMESHGLGGQDDLLKHGTFSWPSGYATADELFRTVDPPSAVFAANDLMAIGAMKAAQERQMRIPHDVSIIGYDGIDTTQLMTPRLTSVRRPQYESGTLAVELLLRRVQAMDAGEKCPPQLVTLTPELLLRESVGYKAPDKRTPVYR